MSSRNAKQARLNHVHRPPSYYQRARQEHKENGRTAPLEAPNTSKSKRSLLKKWHGSVTLYSYDENLHKVAKQLTFSDQVLLRYRRACRYFPPKRGRRRFQDVP